MTVQRKRIMREFAIDFISSVDHPAQEGALALLAKRRTPSDDELRKDCYLSIMTAADESGHQHLVSIYPGSRASETGSGKAMGEEYGHNHPWTLDPSTGALVIGENHGHSHSVDARHMFDVLLALSKAAAPTDQPSEGADVNELEKAKAEIEVLKGRLEDAERRASLTDAQRAHVSKLAASDASAFLKLDRAGREDALAKAAAADPVVFTAGDGTIYRKSDDARLVKMAQEREEDRKIIRETRDAAVQATLEKRAEAELGNLPGTVQERAGLLRAIDAIADQPAREAALKAARAGSDALSKSFTRVGTRGGESATLPGASGKEAAEQRIDELAKSYATANKVTLEAAFSKVLGTPEGAALYRETISN